MKEKKVGRVSHYYGRPKVAIIELNNKVTKGDKLHFVGHTTDFEQTINSLEHEKKQVEEMPRGHSIGVEVGDRVREHDDVFKVIG